MTCKADYAAYARLGRASVRTDGHPSQIILTAHELCSTEKSFLKKKNGLNFSRKRCQKKSVENQEIDKNDFFEKKNRSSAPEWKTQKNSDNLYPIYFKKIDKK